MSFLIFSYRHQQIIALKNELNFKLLQLNQKLMDLASYGASIADGSVSARDLMDAPPSLFGRMVAFNNYANQMSGVGAQQKMTQFMMMGGQQNMAQVPPQLQRQYQQTLYEGFIKQEREKACEVEKTVLNAQEKKINMQVAQLQNQLKMLDAEEQNVTKGEDEGAKKSAPQYVA